MSELSSLSRERFLASLAFLLGLATILGAWGSQLVGGLVPCDLCLEQRMAYYWGLPILLVVLVLFNRLPRIVWFLAMAIVAAIFLWSTWMGGYHAGVEWGFWPGPTACTGNAGGPVDISALQDLNSAHIVPCDQVQFRFLGISLAGYNALISIVIVGLIAAAMLLRARRTA